MNSKSMAAWTQGLKSLIELDLAFFVDKGAVAQGRVFNGKVVDVQWLSIFVVTV